ncbi:MAG: exo-alpha-sialidase [Gemmatimonadetes bacterium]|nr:exo-alpha-sialidase [Gemmatimonadota bacterium]
MVGRRPGTLATPGATRVNWGAAAALAGLAACTATRGVAVPSVSPVELAARGFDAPVHRIPALALSTRGTLIAAWDARPTMADVPSHIRLVMRRSRDGGRNWDDLRVVRADTAPLGFGDPSLLVDRATGRVFLFHAASVRQGFFGGSTGTRDDDPDVLQADVSWSDDDGATWTHRRLTSGIKAPGWGGFFASSGAGVQLRSGRLLQPFVIRKDGATWAAVLRSDDHGDHWTMGALVGPGLDEFEVVELSNGTVMLNSRAKPYRLVAISTDGGVTFTVPRSDRALPDPANNASLIRVDPLAPPGTARARQLVFSNTADTLRRANLTLRLSCDDGATWRSSHVLAAGPSAYSTLVMLPDDVVGVLYEHGAYDGISFARLPLGTIGRC